MNDGMGGVFNFSTTHGASANHKVMPFQGNPLGWQKTADRSRAFPSSTSIEEEKVTMHANRYRWFGKFDACIIPSPEIKSRFLV